MKFVVSANTSYLDQISEGSEGKLAPLLKSLVAIEKPAKISLYLFGFNSFQLALHALHKQASYPFLTELFDSYIACTDIDLLVCSPDLKLTNFMESYALNYYQKLEQAVMGQFTTVMGDELTSDHLSFKYEGLDCSLQRNPVEHFLFSSCQAFYDLHAHAFIFKNKKCYDNFMRRKIYTEDLVSLIEQVKKELKKDKNRMPKLRTLTFLIKLHLKMRSIGWSLSAEDRAVLQEKIIDDKTIYTHNDNETALSFTLAGWLDHNLRSWQSLHPDKFIFVERLKYDFPGKEFNTSLLLEQTDWDIREYLVYKSLDTTQEHLRAIQWMLDQPIPTPVEKEEVIENYFTNLRNDKPTNLDDFINNAPEAILDYLRGIKSAAKYIPNKKQASVSLPLTAQYILPSKKNQNVFREQAKAQLKLLTEAEVKQLNNEFAAINLNHCWKEYQTSNTRGMLFLVLLALTLMANIPGANKFAQDNSNNDTFVTATDLLIIIALSIIDRLITCAVIQFTMDNPEQYRSTGFEILKRAHQAFSGPGPYPSLPLNIYYLQMLQYLYRTTPQNESYRKMIRDYCAKHQDTSSMITYLGVLVGPICRLNCKPYSMNELMSLICAIADHFKIKHIDKFWTHSIDDQYIESIIDIPTAVKNVTEVFSQKITKTKLESVIHALPLILDLSPYRQKLPTLINFIDSKRNDPDLGVKYKIYFRTLDFFNEDSKRKEHLENELNHYMRLNEKPGI